jgi:hypothetical protein
MRKYPRAPTVGQVPTLSDGLPPDLDIQEQVVSNQVRAAGQWDDTAQDMVLSDIINEREEVREIRWETLAIAVVTLVLLIAGIIWTYNSVQQDRLLASEKAAGTRTPYTPETIR